MANKDRVEPERMTLDPQGHTGTHLPLTETWLMPTISNPPTDLLMWPLVIVGVACRAGRFPMTLHTNLAQSLEKRKKESQWDLELPQVWLLAQANGSASRLATDA